MKDFDTLMLLWLAFTTSFAIWVVPKQEVAAFLTVMSSFLLMVAIIKIIEWTQTKERNDVLE